jgi:hypothetical protein
MCSGSAMNSIHSRNAKRWHAIALLSLLLVSTIPMRGQVLPLPPVEIPPTVVPRPPLEPGRPDVTNATHIVDVGLLQLEMGGLVSRSAGDRRNIGTPLTARIGLTDWLEARLGGDGLVVSADLQSRESAVGNVQLGLKLRLSKQIHDGHYAESRTDGHRPPLEQAGVTPDPQNARLHTPRNIGVHVDGAIVVLPLQVGPAPNAGGSARTADGAAARTADRPDRGAGASGDA